MTDAEREELETLRAKVANMERTRADQMNPNVLLLEGRLDSGSGEYYAVGVRDGNGTVRYLAEAVKDVVGWGGKTMTVQYHLSSEPMSFYDLEEHLAKTALGLVKAEFYHRYSDLTGYLWTEEEIKVGNHDILKEISEARRELKGPVYIAFRAERSK